MVRKRVVDEDTREGIGSFVERREARFVENRERLRFPDQVSNLVMCCPLADGDLRLTARNKILAYKE